MTPIKKPVRKLSNLFIREISSVDGGAGYNTRIVLAKRHDDTDGEEPAMPHVTIDKAIPLLNEMARLIALRDGCSMSKAFDRCDPDLLALAKAAGSGLHSSDGNARHLETGPVHYPPAQNTDSSGRNQRSLAGSGHAADADELARLRAAHEALTKFNRLVDDHVGRGMKKSAAQSLAIRDNPALWQQAKGATGHAAAVA